MRFAPAQFPATVARSTSFGDLVVTETLYGAGQALPLHSHEFACFVLVLSGTFLEWADGLRRHCAPGMVIVRPREEPHRNQFDGTSARCLNVEISHRWLAHMREDARLFDTPGTFVSAAYGAKGERLSAHLANPSATSGLELESLLLAFAAERPAGPPPPGAPPRWLLLVRERLHSRPSEPLSLSHLAAEAGVHPVHLAMTFRKYFGTTVGRYLRRLRVEAACRALAGSRASLAEVALEAGYADQSHLGRAMKTATGSTPASYRALTQGACEEPQGRRQRQRAAS